MKRIAIAVEEGSGLEAEVSAHFGRCPYYALVDVDEGRIGELKVVANPFYGRHQPRMVPGFIDQQKAGVIITGAMGPRAIALFDQYGIEAVTGAAGKARDALDAYLCGQLKGAAGCGRRQRAAKR